MITRDNRPSFLEYAKLSSSVFNDSLGGDFSHELPDWRVHEEIKLGAIFFALLFENEKSCQCVLVYCCSSHGSSSIDDIQQMTRHAAGLPHKDETIICSRQAVEYARNRNYQLSFTGYSLGGFLAELSVYFCQKFFNYIDTNAVTFESPGSVIALESLGVDDELKKRLDIVELLGYPNLLNTHGHHVGTCYQAAPPLQSPLNHTHFNLIVRHTMHDFINYLSTLSPLYRILKWPNSTSVCTAYMKKEKKILVSKSYKSLSDSLGIAELQRNFYFTCADFYQLSPVSSNSLLLLRHIHSALRQFLISFHENYWTASRLESGRRELKEFWKAERVPEVLLEFLERYRLSTWYPEAAIIDVGEEGVSFIDNFRREVSRLLADNMTLLPLLLGKREHLLITDEEICSSSELIPVENKLQKVTQKHHSFLTEKIGHKSPSIRGVSSNANKRVVKNARMNSSVFQFYQPQSSRDDAVSQPRAKKAKN